MSMSWFMAVAAGLSATIGAGGLFMASLFRDDRRRRLTFKVGTYGLTMGGLLLMLGSVAGVFGPQELWGGLLMAVFGTGSSILPRRRSNPQTSDRPNL
jgi:hypothetical protein